MRELLVDGYIPSFCTACYRLGRTGEHFMEFAIPGLHPALLHAQRADHADGVPGRLRLARDPRGRRGAARSRAGAADGWTAERAERTAGDAAAGGRRWHCASVDDAATRDLLLLDRERAATARREEPTCWASASVPADALCGIHTLRAIENFPLAGRPVHRRWSTPTARSSWPAPGPTTSSAAGTTPRTPPPSSRPARR